MKKIYLLLIPVLFPLMSVAQTPDELFLMGAAYLERGMYSDAVEQLTRVVQQGRYEETSLMKRGEAYYHMNIMDLAIADFTIANELDNGIAHLWLARCHARKGENMQAIACLEQHLVSEFRIPENQIKKDPAFDDLQMTDEWFTLWQNDWYTTEEHIIREADYYIGRQRPDEALDELESGIAQGITGPGLFCMRGRINLEQGNVAPAVSDFTSAINLDKTNLEYYKYRGFANIQAGRYADAADDFTRVLRNEPEYFKGYLGRAEAYAGMESYDLAIQDATTYLKYFESDQDAIFRCGTYCFQQGDYLNALRYFNVNMQDDDNNAAYYKARGKTYTMTRTYQYAIYDLTMSLDLDPSDGETWLYLGMARMATGDREAACSDFEKAQRLGETRALSYILENCQ